MVPNQTAASEQMCKLEGYIGRKQLVGSRTSSHAEPLNIELRMSGCKNRHPYPGKFEKWSLRKISVDSTFGSTTPLKND